MNVNNPPDYDSWVLRVLVWILVVTSSIIRSKSLNYNYFQPSRSTRASAKIESNSTTCKLQLKAEDTIGNCQRLAFTVGVSQHMHKITNLSKLELNRSMNLRDNKERNNTIVTRSCVRLDGWFRDLRFLNLRSRNQIREKLLPSRKLWHFRGSRFSQCFIPSTSPHYSSPRKVLC